MSRRLRRAREELAVLDEQLQVFRETAEDTRIRALVSETPLASREAEEASRHVDAMLRAREALERSIADLVKRQDDLLEQLPPALG